MKHYMAEYDYSDAVLTFTAKNKKEATEKLNDLVKTEGHNWYLTEVGK